jgi:NAD(P)-dependent dehydrogenase (short-subunit alcohol dehydrogenase family)
MQTVLITGCSSGFGLETARLFLERGWNVVATMRTPNADLLPPSERLRVLALDVGDSASIRATLEAAGPIDALVNNAGIGVLYPLEATPMDTVREVFETNTLGAIALTQAVLPTMRARGAGTIVNVTSTVTLKPLPLLAVYTASKAAVNAFTESLALELEPLGIRARLVLPGMAPTTRFGANAEARMQGDLPDAYRPMLEGVFTGMRAHTGPLTQAVDVAEAVWRAVTDPNAPMRIPAGADAEALAASLQSSASTN